MKYSILETAIVDEVRTHFQVAHRDQVVAGDVDRLLKQLLEGGQDYGVLLEFGGVFEGVVQNKSPSSNVFGNGVLLQFICYGTRVAQKRLSLI